MQPKKKKKDQKGEAAGPRRSPRGELEPGVYTEGWSEASVAARTRDS